MTLAHYACQSATSRGRIHPETAAPTRSDFQRDRDRIIHCTAFRRLVYKTQVFLNHEGDLFRTRLTHSLEVAQLGRAIARNLALNEDLVEAIALAHDLGHTPFGHAGQDALNACLKADNSTSSGFEHNLQSLRVVDRLEHCYPAHDGLNLTFETREGILKHCSNRNALRIEAREPAGVAQRFIRRSGVNGYSGQPGLEAQLANLADEIAYNAHDIDDGVRSGLLVFDELDEVELFKRHRQESLCAHPTLRGRRLLFDTIRRMLSAQVYDVTHASRLALQAAAPASVDAVRCLPALICFSDEMVVLSKQLKRFLHQKLYRHPQVTQTTDTAQAVIRDLFEVYIKQPWQMGQGAPDQFSLASGLFAPNATPPGTASRVIADYIAGMTDRFATREYERLTGRFAFAGQ